MYTHTPQLKSGTQEALALYAPQDLPTVIAKTVPIVFGVIAYWVFRTPVEVIKTRVQTGQQSSSILALNQAIEKDPAGLWGLWRNYPVMLSLDIPFQLLIFILYSFIGDAVAGAAVDISIGSRLFCGASSGMVSL